MCDQGIHSIAMDPDDLKRWRRETRTRLLRARDAVPAATVDEWRRLIDSHLAQAFPMSSGPGVLALCWPIRNEYDPRHMARALRVRGWMTALPVVVAPRQPLAFREWHPGVELAMGAMDIPYPRDSATVAPDVVLLPMVGWDGACYRLGYGAGFFDRTLASLAKRPLVIGIGYEIGRLETIHPQSWDIPADCVVTEAGIHRPR